MDFSRLSKSFISLNHLFNDSREAASNLLILH